MYNPVNYVISLLDEMMFVYLLPGNLQSTFLRTFQRKTSTNLIFMNLLRQASTKCEKQLNQPHRSCNFPVTFISVSIIIGHKKESFQLMVNSRFLRCIVKSFNVNETQFWAQFTEMADEKGYSMLKMTPKLVQNNLCSSWVKRSICLLHFFQLQYPNAVPNPGNASP